MKSKYLKEVMTEKTIETSLMIIKILSREDKSLTAYIGDKTGEIKAIIKDEDKSLQVGEVIHIKATYRNPIKIEGFKKISHFDIYDYIPSVNRPIDDIMTELNELSSMEFKSKEIIALDNYFFKNEKFLEKFKKAIGGVYHHHNYLGGLAEHTLNVMYLAKVFSHRYDARYKEIAILGAKLHDIGKTREMYYDGPFGYTLEGEMEGHIVIGVTMLEEAFRENPDLYPLEFRERMKAIVVQHHGELEYGSPRKPKSQESFIVHYADYVDATLNKIDIISQDVEEGNWTGFERRIEGRLYL